MSTAIDLNGVAIWKSLIDRGQQKALTDALRRVAEHAPFRQYATPGGQRMSVRMSGAGQAAWMSDRSGYRYAALQPNGESWPEIPGQLLEIWRTVSGVARDPDTCLVNFYGPGTKMGMHQDKDEADLSWPVVSISLGDDALFRVGGPRRGGKTQSIWLASGDVAVLAGKARLHHHGIDRIKSGSSTLLPKGGRLNATLRVAG